MDTVCLVFIKAALNLMEEAKFNHTYAANSEFTNQASSYVEPGQSTDYNIKEAYQLSDHSKKSKNQSFKEFKLRKNRKNQKVQGSDILQIKPRTLKALSQYMNDFSNLNTKSISYHENTRHQQNFEGQKYKISDKKRKQLKKLIVHLFKYHFIGDKIDDYRTHVIRIFFTIKVLQNNILAHFLMNNFLYHTNFDSVISRNKIILHQQYFDSKINEKYQKNSQVFNQNNLQKMLDLNQLISKFEKRLDIISTNIAKFWKTLIQEKESFSVYDKGLKISTKLNKLNELYEQIQVKQGEQKEIKVYVLMSGFFRYVIFKQQESQIEIQKSRQVYQTKKIATFNREQDFTNEKGLLIATLDMKKPMEVEFINKNCMKLIQYKQQEAIGMKVNSLMPQQIAENHHKFIQRFMSTGRYGVINQKRELFVKIKSGYLVPIITYLCINHHNIRNLILIVEKNENYSIFQDEEDDVVSDQAPNHKLTGKQRSHFLLADKDLRIYEMSENVQNISVLSNSLINQIKQSYGYQPSLDDLFYNLNLNSDLKDQHDNGINEFEVHIKSNATQIYDEMIQHGNDSLDKEEQKLDNKARQTQFASRFLREQGDTTYLLKISNLSLMGGQFILKVIGLKPLWSGAQSTTAFPILHMESFKQTNGTIKNIQNAGNQPLNQQIKISMSQQRSNDQYEEESENNFDMSSQTSTTSSSSTIMQKFNQYNNSVKSQRIPITLKVILQIVIVVFLIIIVTSTITLSLTLSNSNDARTGIKVSNLSISRLNSITQLRVIFRQLYNMAQNYVPIKTELLDNRFEFYTEYCQQVIESLRKDQVQLQVYDSEMQGEIPDIKLTYLQIDNTLVYEYRVLGQAINLYVAKCDDLVQRAKLYGVKYLVSELTYFVFANQVAESATLTERDGFFIIENGNQDLFYRLSQYAKLFSQKKQDSIEVKVQFSSIMSWVCIGILVACGLSNIPLFNRIQDRIFVLMRIFFTIDKQIKNQMVLRINKFQMVLKPPEQEDDNHQPEENVPATVDHANQQENTADLNPKQNQKMLFSNLFKKRSQQKRDNTLPSSTKYNTSKFKPKKNNRKYADKEVEMNIEEIEEESKEEIQDQQMEVEEDASPSTSQNQRQKKKNKRKGRKNSGYQESEEVDKTSKRQQQKQQQQTNALLKFFANQIQKRKITQSLIVILMTVIFNSYFLGTYFLSTSTFNQMSESIEIIFSLFNRKSCAENTIHAITEAIIANETYLINNEQDEIVEYFSKTCEDVESNYQKRVRRNKPQYLEGIYSYLDKLEDGTFCQDTFNDGQDGFDQVISVVNVDTCQTFGNSISKQGITQIYQQIYQICKQMLLEYQGAERTGQTGNIQLLLKIIAKPMTTFDVLEIVLQKPNILLNEIILDSLDQFFSESAMIFIVIFVIFILFTVIIMTVFLFSNQILFGITLLQIFLRSQEGR
ncbi:pas pac sensor signal transduction histidine kinase [Stylonychia lemnae]|uniref:Pas pac sensor signal transduction histidine kinase n=1 Tax=Stylonychia lemnae TaxID=5949 RepID=A0A077ZV00_STYLE|nr:pas pac sensor signal transduction histidine kinase [Stylonychia lemnae]|eukprot:CDW73414.1 pas pac sensor signal transduction histidine kinase [Stylonychia lemnae]